MLGLALAALVCPPALAEDGPTAEVDLRATIAPPPFHVCTLLACDIDYTSAILWGAVVREHPPSKVEVSFGWDDESHEDDPDGYANWTPADRLFLGVIFHAGLDGLEPGKTYYFRARAETDEYTGYGEEMSFTTPPELRVVTLPARDIGPGKATLYGKTIGRFHSSRVKVSFVWDIESHDDEDGYANQTPTQNARVGDSFDARITRLEPETTYYFRARAELNGAAFYGEEKSFTTPPELQVITLPAGNIEDKKATLYGKTISEDRSKVKVSFGWDKVSHDSVEGDESGYAYWTSTQNVRPGDVFNVKLTKLDPGTTYYFRARGERGGKIANGEELVFTTPPEQHGNWSWWDWVCGCW